MYKPGTENISKQQADMLRRARFAIEHANWLVVRETLEQIAVDGDISSGDEELDPGWHSVIDAYRREWEHSAPKRTLNRIFEMQKALETPGSNLSQFDPTRSKLTFLLGAGASKPAPSNIPTVKELLNHLLARAQRLDREDLNRLETYCKKNKITNIEDLLTAAQLATFCSRSPNVLGLMDHLIHKNPGRDDEGDDYDQLPELYAARNRADLSSVSFLQDTLQVLFGLLSNMMLPAKPNLAHQSIAIYASRTPGCNIVTTNYDCCIDLALGTSNRDYDYSLSFSKDAVTKNESRHKSKTKLIKLHGSLNWYYCDTCQEIRLREAASTVSGFLKDETPYSIISICKACGGQQRALLVPPSLVKFDVGAPLNQLLNDARLAFLSADFIVSVGFSFSDADAYIFRLVGKAMQSDDNCRLLIFDQDPSVAIRVRRRLAASIPNFQTGRVVEIVGDCSELLPNFLAGKYLTGDGRKSALPRDARKKATTKGRRRRPAH